MGFELRAAGPHHPLHTHWGRARPESWLPQTRLSSVSHWLRRGQAPGLAQQSGVEHGVHVEWVEDGGGMASMPVLISY